MAFDNCVATIRQAAPNLNEQQAKELKDEVVDILERLQADKNVADLDAELKKAVNERVAQEERAAINEKRNRALNYKTRLRFIQQLREVPEKDIPAFLESILSRTEGNSLYKKSIESTANAYGEVGHALFFRAVEDAGVPRGEAVSFLRKARNGEALMLESYEPGSSGNETARIIAEAMEKTNDHLRKQANKYGADIARIPGYLVKQSHDSMKIIRATKEAWVEDIMKYLDEERTFGRPMTDAAKRKYLNNVYKTLTTEQKHDDYVKDLSADPVFKGPGNLGKKLSHHRSLHFKNGKAAWEYMKAYGRPDVGTSFFGGVDMLSRSIAAMQHLGPNPKYMLDDLVKRARAKIGDNAKIANKINDAKLEHYYNRVTGAGSILPVYHSKGFLLTRGINLLKNLSGAALLGGTTLTSVADIGTSSVRLSEVGMNFLEAHKSVLGGLLQGRRSGEKRQIADSLAVGMEHLISGVQSRFLGAEGMEGQGSFLLSGVMRITGMNWLTDTLKTSVALSLSNFIARQIGKSFDGLNVTLRREMSAYGITADEFATLGTAVREVEGKAYLDLDALDNPDFSLKMKEFFNGFADSAVLTPGARTQALITPGKRGEPLTEMMLVFMHLKSFSVSYWNEILSRAWKGEGVRVGYGLHLAASMAVYGYLASTLKDLAAGKEPREIGPKALLSAMATSGGLGFYGDVVIGTVGRKERFGEGVLEAIGGPVIGTGIRSAKALADLARGDVDKASNKAMRAAKSMIPGANIFYSRIAVDYLFFWQLQEYLRPGWARSFEKRVHEETGQDFYLRPTEAVN